MAISEKIRRRAREDAERKTDPADLEEIRREVDRWRDLSLEKSDLEERLRATNIAVSELEFTTLPTLMDELKISRMDVEAKGNQPAVTLEAKPYYHANIAADWPEEKRRAAFKALEDLDHGDLIRTEIVISIPREEREKAKQIVAVLEKKALNPVVRESVHFSTLTAFVREQTEAEIEDRKANRPPPEKPRLPPLDVIGARIGRIVKPKIVEKK